MSLHPAFILFGTALVVALTRGKFRQIALIAGALLALIVLSQLGPLSHWTFALPNYTFQLLQVDTLNHVFGLIFGLTVLIGAIYALHLQSSREHVAALVYAGGALGVVLAGDFMTLFVFWELMAVASLFVVMYGGTPQAHAAGFRYLLVHIFGGSILFCGILIHLAEGGTATLQALTTPGSTPSAAFWLMLVGVAINAAVPPLHAWLADAYPQSSITGSVFLSAFTTKTAVYVLIRLFPGADILLWAGVIMTLYGVVYAILANDMRSLLSYHIVSQVGYMVAAVGIGSQLAINGAVAHAFCHILYKSLLFMGAGSIIYATGKRRLTDLGGLMGSLPLVFLLYMVGAVSISGFPLFNGFISKSMIISAAAEGHFPIAELLLTLASIGTFVSVALKVPYFAFFGPNRGLSVRPVPSNMLIAMGIGAFFCTALGLFPGWLYARLPFASHYHPYTVDHIVSALQLLVGAGFGFWWLLPRLHGHAVINVDTDWLYRKPLPPAVDALVSCARAIGGAIETLRIQVIRAFVPYFQNPFLPFSQLRLSPSNRRRLQPEEPSYDADAYRFPIGTTVLWIVICFALATLYTLGRQPTIQPSLSTLRVLY